MGKKSEMFKDGFFTASDSSPSSKLFGGIIGPLLIAVVGIVNIVTQQAHIGRRYHSLIEGEPAIFIGIERIALALLMHSHFFWTVTEKLYPYANVAKIVTFLIWLASFVCFFVVEV